MFLLERACPYRDTVSRAEYERLKSEHDAVLQKNSQLLSERVEISSQMDQLNTANSQLRKEIEKFETQVSQRLRAFEFFLDEKLILHLCRRQNYND